MTEIAVPEVVANPGLYPHEPQSMVTMALDQAARLSDIIKEQKLFTKIGKKEHVSVEGWTTLGAMVGVFPIVEWTRELVDEDGKQLGWEARVEARTLQGAIVGAAEAECRRTESTWKSRDSYALRSMAQTRATSKALRLPLGFIMALAGYEATPNEEVPVGAINQAKREVLALLDGDKDEATSLWNAALEDLELDANELTAEHVEPILSAIKEMIDLTNQEGGEDDNPEGTDDGS